MWRPFFVLHCSFLLLLVEPLPYLVTKRAVIKTNTKRLSRGPIWPHWFVDDKRSGSFGDKQSLSGQCALAIESKIQCWRRSGPAVERALDLLLIRNAMESAVDDYRLATYAEPYVSNIIYCLELVDDNWFVNWICVVVTH